MSVIWRWRSVPSVSWQLLTQGPDLALCSPAAGLSCSPRFSLSLELGFTSRQINNAGHSHSQWPSCCPCPGAGYVSVWGLFWGWMNLRNTQHRASTSNWSGGHGAGLLLQSRAALESKDQSQSCDLSTKLQNPAPKAKPRMWLLLHKWLLQWDGAEQQEGRYIIANNSKWPHHCDN